MSGVFFEAVPNISAGRDARAVEACAAAVSRHARLAHVTSDAAHDRSVLTYFGDAEQIAAASIALAEVAVEMIDLRAQRGVHPRIGALDVLPFVPIGEATFADADTVAKRVASELWQRLRLPAYFYGEIATAHEKRTLPEVRRGEFEGLALRDATFAPDVGDRFKHESAGAVAIGVRRPLIAFNVDLDTGDLTVAKRIARTIRESSGGLRTLRALGLALSDCVQVSCNITDAETTPIPLVTAIVARAAERAGARVKRSELIGLVPRAALAAVATDALGLE